MCACREEGRGVRARLIRFLPLTHTRTHARTHAPARAHTHTRPSHKSSTDDQLLLGDEFCYVTRTAARLLLHRLFGLWTPAANSHTYIAYTDANTHTHMHLRLRVRVHLCMYEASNSRSIMKVCICVHTNTHNYTSAHEHTHTHPHLHTD